jgi:hypothetical protein
MKMKNMIFIHKKINGNIKLHNKLPKITIEVVRACLLYSSFKTKIAIEEVA